MRIAVPRETQAGERRVALAPEACGKLVKKGHEIVVETGAGADAGFPDPVYEAAGATVVPRSPTWLEGADAVVRVQPPEDESDTPEGSVLIAFLSPMTRPDLLERLARRRVTAFAMEAVPRITRAQKMDALSSQATVAGYRAVLIAAQELPRFLPMFMTAAGTVPPAKALILGAGVAGLQAIATARRLGAVVSAFDVRPAVKEQVQSLGATFLEAELDHSAETAGGYARALSDEEHQRELELIGGALPDMDVVITTAQIPGKPAPRLITRAMVETMRPGAVIVDLASESGGNCEVTRSGERVVHHGVTVLGPVNLPASLPYDASQMYGRNVQAFLEHLSADGALHLDFEDEITKGACVTHAGEIRFGPARQALGLSPLTAPATSQ
ncbi:MAG: Re/Si-specific NAD(P)(+) transhydrogenase subunit alpha [Gemmatimonadota bacterium]|nr:Re/Si-specific NAD(P)(+) transhydrogenase subunit alpha [Gemmatimonadota bacterium]